MSIALKMKFFCRFLQLGMCCAIVVCLGCNPQPNSGNPQSSSGNPKASTQPKPAIASVGNASTNAPKILEPSKIIPSDVPNGATAPKVPILEGPAKTNQESSEDGQQAKSTPPKKVYTKAELQKNNTVLLLSMPPDIRARAILQFLREDLSPDEMELAVRFVMEHDQLFQTMIQRRATILDEAEYGDDTILKRHRLKIDIFETANRIRSLAMMKFLTEERQAARKLRIKEDAELLIERRKQND